MMKLTLKNFADAMNEVMLNAHEEVRSGFLAALELTEDTLIDEMADADDMGNAVPSETTLSYYIVSELLGLLKNH